MAGTGHAYEIANPADLDAALAAAARRVPEGPGTRWFASRQVRRHLSGPDFAARIDGRGIRAYAAATSMPDVERDRLLAKAEEGDVRFFSAMSLPGRGVDLDHVADWIAEGLLEGPGAARFARSLPFVTLPQAVAKAGRMARAASRRDEAARAVVLEVAEGRDGRRWLELLNEDALRLEAEAMHHCVGNASYRGALGRSARFFSLRCAEGWPRLTVECRTTGPTVAVAQVKGFANSIGYVEYRQDILDLAGALAPSAPFAGAEGAGERDLASMDIVFAHGAWHDRETLFRDMEIDGVACQAHGREVRFTAEGRPVALSGRTVAWWVGGESDRRHVRVDFYGRDGIAARTLASRLLRHFRAAFVESDSDGLVEDGPSDWRPWEDTGQASTRSGLLCRSVGDRIVVHLPQSGGTAVLAERGLSFPSSELSFSRMPTADDARALVPLLDGMPSVRFDDRCAVVPRVRKLGLAHARYGRWFFRPDAETTEAAKDGGEWRLTPWSADLVRGSDLAFCVLFDDERRVRSLHGRSLAEGTAMMNRLRLTDGGAEFHWQRRPATGRERTVVHDGKRWIEVGPRSDLDRRVRGIPSETPVPPSLSRAVRRRGDAGGADRDVYARCVAEWLVAARPSFSTPLLGDDERAFPRLVSAVASIASLDAATAGRLVAAAVETLAAQGGHWRIGEETKGRLMRIWFVAALGSRLRASERRKLLSQAVGGRRAVYMSRMSGDALADVPGGRAGLVETIAGALSAGGFGKYAAKVRAAVENMLENDMRHVVYGKEDGRRFEPQAVEGARTLLRLRAGRGYASSWDAERAERDADALAEAGCPAELVDELRSYAAGMRERLAAWERERAAWREAFRNGTPAQARAA